MKIRKNDKQIAWIIGIFSFVVFAIVAGLGFFHLPWPFSFSVHVFAFLSAMINTITFFLLLIALWAIKSHRIHLHRNLMLTSLVLSILFLIFYIAHHLFSGETHYGGVGWIRLVYFTILTAHIFLASIILPFILFTTYRALIQEIDTHRKLAKITWPVWVFVATTGPIVYIMILPYYH